MGRYDDQKIYRTFEEFEREELRRDAGGGSFDELVDEMFAGELDFDGYVGQHEFGAPVPTNDPILEKALEQVRAKKAA